MSFIKELFDLNRYSTHKRAPFFKIAASYHRSPGKALDIGAGNGEFADLLADPDVHLIEGNPVTASALRERYHHVYELRIPEPLPFPNGYFSLIHSSHLIEHLSPQDLYMLLAEMDRCLAPGGYLVISTPLPWEGFYDDLSHVRPYTPYILRKYLCSADNLSVKQRTRRAISGDYSVVQLVYRYRSRKIPILGAGAWAGPLNWLFVSMGLILSNIAPRVYEKTGYTLALRKNDLG